MQLTKHWAALLEDYVIDLAWSPDGARLAAASGSGPITLFEANTGTKHQVLPGHDEGTNCVAWNTASTSAGNAEASTNPLFASGGQDGTVKFWDTAAGQHTATVELGSTWVEHLAWRPTTEKPLLAASCGRQLYFIKADGTRAHAFKPAPKTLSALAWQPAGGCLAAAYFGGVCLWDADDFVAQKEYAYGNGIHALVWSPDNRWLVSGNQDPSVHLWIPETDVELHMSGYEGKVKELSFDTTSRWLATGGSKEACVWDCTGAGPEGREPVMLPHEGKVCAVAFQNKHGLLATASEDGAVVLWSPERKQPLRATIRMPALPTKIAWSPDDNLLAIGSEKGAVYILRCQG